MIAGGWIVLEMAADPDGHVLAPRYTAAQRYLIRRGLIYNTGTPGELYPGGPEGAVWKASQKGLALLELRIRQPVEVVVEGQLQIALQAVAMSASTEGELASRLQVRNAQAYRLLQDLLDLGLIAHAGIRREGQDVFQVRPEGELALERARRRP